MLLGSCFYKNLYQIIVTEYKLNAQKISRVGQHWGSNQGNQNARRRNAFKTTQLMDRKSFRNRKKVRILGNTFNNS